MHIVSLIRRRFPNHQGKIIAVLILLSISGIAIGLGIKFLVAP